MIIDFKMAHNSIMTGISDNNKVSVYKEEQCEIEKVNVSEKVDEEEDDNDFDEVDGFFFSSNKGTYKPRDLELETQLEESDDDTIPFQPDTCSINGTIMYLVHNTSTKRWRDGILGLLRHCKQEANIRKSLLVLYDKIKWFLDKLTEDQDHVHNENDQSKSTDSVTLNDHKRKAKTKAPKHNNKTNSKTKHNQSGHNGEQKDQKTELNTIIDHIAHCFTRDDLYIIIPGYLSLRHAFGDDTETPEYVTEKTELKTEGVDNGDTVDRVENPDRYVLEGLSHLVRHLLYMSYTNVLLLPTVDGTLMQHLSRAVELLTDGHGIPTDSRPALLELMDCIPSIMKSLGFKLTTIEKAREIKSTADDFDEMTDHTKLATQDVKQADLNGCDIIEKESKDLKLAQDDFEHDDLSTSDTDQSELTLKTDQSNERKDTDPEEDSYELKRQPTEVKLDLLEEGTSAGVSEADDIDSDVTKQTDETDSPIKTQTTLKSTSPEIRTCGHQEQQMSNLVINRKYVTSLQWQLPDEQETFNRLRFVILGLFGGLLTDI